jgi:hypothetical protein
MQKSGDAADNPTSRILAKETRNDPSGILEERVFHLKIKEHTKKRVNYHSR